MSERRKADSPIPLLALLTLVYLTGYVAWEGASRGLGFWYITQIRPVWAPPTWLFVPVWTLLLGFVGAGLWRIWRSPHSGVRTVALLLAGLSLCLKAGWSWTFFAHGLYPLSLGLAASRLAFSIAAAVAFRKAEPGAAWYLVPDLAWASYVVLLTLELQRLNR